MRIPVLPVTGDCKPFQEVLIELGTRLKLPTFVTKDGRRKYRDYPDFIVNWETEPGSGIGFLSGWRGKGGEKFLIGEPNPRQWEMYEQHNCVYHHELPRSFHYMRNWNQGYLEWSRSNRITRYAEPILIHLYSEVLQHFRSAAQGKGVTRKPPEHLKARIATYFDPLPFYYEPLESHVTDKHKYPLAAVTQRPMAMYHSWDSQNAWLRQIHTHNVLTINTQHRAQRRHRAGRLDLGRIAMGQGALSGRPVRSRGARHSVDLERHRQGRRRVGPGARCQRVAPRVPAQPPDLRRTAQRPWQLDDLELRPDHRPGRLVRRAGADLQGRRTSPPKQPTANRSSSRCGPIPAWKSARACWRP